MGVALAERHPEAKALFERARSVLGWDLLEACRSGPDERLRQTDVAQPALYVTGCAAAEVLKAADVQPNAAAGHSIGEYSALTIAGVFSFEEGLRLVRERGRLMQAAAESRPGGMAALLGLSADRVRELCRQASAAGVVVAVNFNSPEQVVIAGERAAVDRVNELAPAAGAKRVIPLNVSGAFHSPLMAEAAREMRALLDKAAFRDATVPVAMNVDGQLRQTAADIRAALGRQLDSAVEWVKTIETLKGAGITVFVECGSGRVLSGLLRRIDKQLQSLTTETIEAVDEAVQAISMSGRGAS